MTSIVRRRLSVFTIGWGLYIVVSASFMLQVNLWLTALVGDPALARSFWIVSGVAMAVIVGWAAGVRPGLRRAAGVLAVFVTAYAFGRFLHDFTDKVHILIYGILGFSASCDLLGRGGRPGLRYVARPLAVIAVVAAADESFQWILPYRFGTIPDFLVNVAGGALGVLLWVILTSDGI